jgi:predicted Fe-S protein YdhL (DUF1289 family)
VNIETPCIKLCIIDTHIKLCRGCGRSANEIAQWSTMVPAQRRSVMDELPARMRQAGLVPAPGGEGHSRA